MKAAASGAATPRTPAELAPIERAAFALAFFEECEAAGSEAPAVDCFKRAMARVQRYLEAQNGRASGDAAA